MLFFLLLVVAVENLEKSRCRHNDVSYTILRHFAAYICIGLSLTDVLDVFKDFFSCVYCCNFHCIFYMCFILLPSGVIND